MSKKNSKTECPYARALLPLVGGTVTSVIVDKGDGSEDPYMGLIVKMPNGKVYEVICLCDPEGNGPGFLDVAEDGAL